MTCTHIINEKENTYMYTIASVAIFCFSEIKFVSVDVICDQAHAKNTTISFLFPRMVTATEFFLICVMAGKNN